MFDKLLALLPAHPGPTPDTVGAPFQHRQVAVAVLLLELAQADHRIPSDELHAIEAVLRQRFHLDAGMASRLVDTAQAILGAALEDWVFAKMVRNSFDAAERVAIFSMLWEVVIADGQLGKLEQDLIEHLGRELGISAGESETARLQALARISGDGTVAQTKGTGCDR